MASVIKISNNVPHRIGVNEDKENFEIAKRIARQIKRWENFIRNIVIVCVLCPLRTRNFHGCAVFRTPFTNLCCAVLPNLDLFSQRIVWWFRCWCFCDAFYAVGLCSKRWVNGWSHCNKYHGSREIVFSTWNLPQLYKTSGKTLMLYYCFNRRRLEAIVDVLFFLQSFS